MQNTGNNEGTHAGPFGMGTHAGTFGNPNGFNMVAEQGTTTGQTAFGPPTESQARLAEGFANMASAPIESPSTDGSWEHVREEEGGKREI